MNDLAEIAAELEGVSGILTVLREEADDRSPQIGTALGNALYCVRNYVDIIVERLNDFDRNHIITEGGEDE